MRFILFLSPPPSPPPPPDLMNMGGYSAAPVMIPGGGGVGSKLGRGSKSRGAGGAGGYSQYPPATTSGAYAYNPSGWGEHMGGGYYGPGYGVQVPMMRGHVMDPAAMEFMTEQFQGEYPGWKC